MSGVDLTALSGGNETAHRSRSRLRNRRAVAAHLAAAHARVTLLGAATGGEFREEDQLCCAWIAEAMVASGFVVEAG